MRFPNLRYGNPAELRRYAEFYPRKERLKILARQLRRSERTVKDWMDEKQKLPWWVPELIRLQRMEHDEMLRHMGMNPMRGRFGIVRGQVIELHRPAPAPDKQKPQGVQDNPGALIELRKQK